MQAASGLTPENPVPDNECWYRLLTNRDFVTRDGTVHYQALKGKAFRSSDQKPWAHELSGRIASLVKDIVVEAESQIKRIQQGFAHRNQPIPSKIRFVGIACATASDLRSISTQVFATDVIYTPLPTDSAHSDFVTYETNSNEDLDPVRFLLMETLNVIEPNEIGSQISSCGS